MIGYGITQTAAIINTNVPKVQRAMLKYYRKRTMQLRKNGADKRFLDWALQQDERLKPAMTRESNAQRIHALLALGYGTKQVAIITNTSIAAVDRLLKSFYQTHPSHVRRAGADRRFLQWARLRKA